MNLKQSIIPSIMLVGCLFTCLVMAESPILIIGQESFDTISEIDYEKRQAARIKKQQAEKAEREAQRRKDEARFRPARCSLKRVMQVLENADSYCGTLVFTDYSGADNTKLGAVDDWVDDFINSEARPVKFRLQLDRCMKKAGDWKIDSLHSKYGLDHQWGNNVQTTTYKPKTRELRESNSKKFKSISDFVFSDQRSLEDLRSRYARSARNIGDFDYGLNVDLSNEGVDVIDKVWQTKSGDRWLQRLEISTKELKLRELSTFLNDELYSKIEFENVVYNKKLGKADLQQTVPLLVTLTFLSKQHPVGAVLLILLLVFSLTFFVGRFSSISKLSAEFRKRLFGFLLVMFVLLLGDLILAIFTAFGSAGHGAALSLLYMFAFGVFGLVFTFVVIACVLGFEFGVSKRSSSKSNNGKHSS